MGSSSGPDGYPRVLDYSIFKLLLVPYSKNLTTRSSSRVVTISFFLSNLSNIQKIEMWNFQTLSWGLFSPVLIAAEAVQYSSTSFFTSSSTSSDSCSSCLEYVLAVFISSNRSSLRGDAPLILAQSLFSLSPSRFWAFICRFWVIWYVLTAYNTMHVAKRIFLAASIGSENFSLPYSLLLDYSTFEFTTLPYPKLKNHYPSGPDHNNWINNYFT